MYDFHEVYSQVNWLQALKTFLQIVIICYGLLWIWRRIIGTQAERLVKGVLVLVAICVLSYALGFELVTGLLQRLIPIAVMAVLVIFQPEIRRGLGYLGRMNTFKLDFALANPEAERAKHDMEQIISAVRELSRTRVGALIVIEPPQGERDYLSPGTQINADISSTLLLTIFFPKAPLHDGAVIIRQHKVIAAGVILPMTTDPKLSFRYGTRHRAAIGLSEIYDGLCIVVSEETGSISAASRGMLVRYNTADDLADPLSYIYSQATSETSASPVQSFLNLIGRRPEEKDARHKQSRPQDLAVASNQTGATGAAFTAVSDVSSDDRAPESDEQKITATMRAASPADDSESVFDDGVRKVETDGKAVAGLAPAAAAQAAPDPAPAGTGPSSSNGGTGSTTQDAGASRAAATGARPRSEAAITASGDGKSGSEAAPAQAAPQRPQLGSIEPEQAL